METDEYCKNYLRHLLHVAVTHTKFLPERCIKSFFRNKNEDYWRDVDNNGNVMMPLRKDMGGDKRSPINGRLKGVFLDITLRNGQLPDKSPFGRMRVVFPVEGLYDDSTNLYFTDFYCKVPTRARNHFVTLVLTKKNSDADDFCKKKLLQLNPETNKFFRRCSGPGQVPSYTTIANPPMHVEVFYTEPVNQRDLEEQFGTGRVYRYGTGIIGKGTSTWGGVPKDMRCAVCNPLATCLLTTPLDVERIPSEAKVDNRLSLGIHEFVESEVNESLTSEEETSPRGADAFSSTKGFAIIPEGRGAKSLSTINSNEDTDPTDEDSGCSQSINAVDRRITRSMAKEMLKVEMEKESLNRRQTRSMKRKLSNVTSVSGNEQYSTGKRMNRF